MISSSEPYPHSPAVEPALRAASSTAPAHCSACAKLLDQERRALTVYDHSKAVDCRVLLARHRAAKHGVRE